MRIIEERNPVYHVTETPSLVRGELIQTRLIGIDVMINETVLPVRKKRKYIVACRKKKLLVRGARGI